MDHKEIFFLTLESSWLYPSKMKLRINIEFHSSVSIVENTVYQQTELITFYNNVCIKPKQELWGPEKSDMSRISNVWGSILRGGMTLYSEYYFWIKPKYFFVL